MAPWTRGNGRSPARRRGISSRVQHAKLIGECNITRRAIESSLCDRGGAQDSCTSQEPARDGKGQTPAPLHA
eukprot:6321243-Pyramimonas_sp.AAC.1